VSWQFNQFENGGRLWLGVTFDRHKQGFAAQQKKVSHGGLGQGGGEHTLVEVFLGVGGGGAHQKEGGRKETNGETIAVWTNP